MFLKNSDDFKVIESFFLYDFGLPYDNIFFLFLQDNDKWLEDYASAYDVMTANGASSLTEISS